MEGSSAIQFGRAAYRRGMICRRQLARDVWANLKFRLQGSTDEGTRRAARPRARRASPASAWSTWRGSRPTCSPGSCRCSTGEMLHEAWEHQDAGRPVFIVTAASQEMAEMLAHVLVLRRRDRHALRGRATASTPASRPARSPTARARRRRSARSPRERGIDLVGVLRLLGLRVRPADDARGRPPGGGEPGRRARARRARGGLADHALRQARRGACEVATVAAGLALVGGSGGYAAAAPGRRRGL